MIQVRCAECIALDFSLGGFRDIVPGIMEQHSFVGKVFYIPECNWQQILREIASVSGECESVNLSS